MSITKSHKIRLNPTAEQLTMFWKSSGTVRFVYNWGLARWKELYEDGEKPSWISLNGEFNAIKNEQFPWTSEVSSRCTIYAFQCLGAAFKNFFDGRAKYPKFKSRHDRPMSFYAANTELKFDDHDVRLPKIGWVNMAEPLRFQGKVMRGVISYDAGHWWLAVSVEMEHEPPEPNGRAVGVDLGLKSAAVTSDGDVFEAIKYYRQSERKLARLQRKMARQQKESSRRSETKKKIEKLHYRVRCQRQDTIHKMTTFLVENYSIIGLEDLNVNGMLKNGRLAKSLSDASFYEIKRQLTYKTDISGGTVQLVGRFYPSSKTCHCCGFVKPELKLSEREWTCEGCGRVLNRDLNAAINIRNEALRLLAECD